MKKTELRNPNSSTFGGIPAPKIGFSTSANSTANAISAVTATSGAMIETPGPREHRDRRWELERACDLELLDLRAGRERGLDGALGKGARDLIVPARPHDRDARTAVGILHPGRSLPSGRHMPQSSRRMQHGWVSK